MLDVDDLKRVNKRATAKVVAERKDREHAKVAADAYVFIRDMAKMKLDRGPVWASMVERARAICAAQDTLENDGG